MENESIRYRIAGIEIVYKTMTQFPSTGVGAQFFFDIRIEFKVSAEHKLVLPFVAIKISAGDEPMEVGSIGVSCLFEIENFEKHIVLNEKGLYHVPPQLQAALTPIAISTTRGVMFAEFRGTYLNNAIMPVVQMASLKKEKSTEEAKQENK